VIKIAPVVNNCYVVYLQESVLEWLHHLQMASYYDVLTADGYYSDVDHVVEITWEDLEEIGIKKLGTITLHVIFVMHARDMF